MATKPIRIRITRYNHYSYIHQGKDGRWRATSQNGTPMALSNYCKDEMVLRFALEDAGDDPGPALAACREHLYPQYAETAELLS